MGDIGEDVREFEFEPFPQHAVPEPSRAPSPAPAQPAPEKQPEKEPVPA